MIRPRTPENRTPRSTHSRNSNQRQDYSPYMPKNQYNIQPESQNNGYNYNMNNAPKTPQRGSIMSNSSASSTKNEDMVCMNCINKHLMMQKQERDRIEKEKDQLLRQIAESNYQNAMKKEMEKQRQMKEQYKNDANVHLDQIQNKRAHEEKTKRNIQNPNDNGNQPNRNPDFERYQKLNQMQQDLKMGLLKQIQEKETEKLYDRFGKDQYKTTLDIGNDNRPRSALPKNYGEDLREQILRKENQKLWEKEVF